MTEEMQTQIKDGLLPLEKYLESGIHIGSKFRAGEMKRFIYKTRPDGLGVLDVSTINERIRIAARFLARYEPADILLVAGRTYAQRPAEKLAELTGVKCIAGRFTPGTLTNPLSEFFTEPKVMLIADPPIDRQALKEAITAKVPVVALCNTSNITAQIDYIIPANNNGKKSLALAYYLLAREILKNRGIIKTDAEFTPTLEDFEAKVTHEERLPDERGREERFGRDRREGGREGGRGFERGGGRGRERGRR